MHYSGTILFYAPLSGQIEGIPSGDKIIARRFVDLFSSLGYKVKFPSHFSSRDPLGDKRFQLLRIEEAAVLKKKVESDLRKLQPKFWVTYHHYHKAPDLLGPELTKKLGIPYIIIEGSLNPKQEKGKWAHYYPFVTSALEQASSLISLNPKDHHILNMAGFRNKNKLITPPIAPCFSKKLDKEESRSRLALEFGLNNDVPWILTIAQMRAHKKLEAYIYLKEAITILKKEAFELLVIGAGESESEVRSLFQSLPQAHFLGEIGHVNLPLYYSACDLFCWPGIGEAIGLVYLEAQAMGLKVIMDRSSGGRHFIMPNVTGFLASNPNNYADLMKKEMQDALKKRYIATFAY
jgi:glycosyltransferase involved in cell wall biosynthesis